MFFNQKTHFPLPCFRREQLNGSFGIMANIFFFCCLYLHCSGEYSSCYCLYSLTARFKTFVFPDGKYQHICLTFKPYESLEQRWQYFVTNISKTPQLSTVALLELSPAFKQTFWYSVFTDQQRSKNWKKEKNHLPDSCKPGLLQLKLAVVNPKLS